MVLHGPRAIWARCLKIPFIYGIMIVKDKEYPHRYPPIITKTLFDQVQKIKRRIQ